MISILSKLLILFFLSFFSHQDIAQQDLKELSVVLIIERIIRFHIYSMHRLIEEDLGAFDPRLNKQNLVDRLDMLKNLYNDISEKNWLTNHLYSNI